MEHLVKQTRNIALTDSEIKIVTDALCTERGIVIEAADTVASKHKSSYFAHKMSDAIEELDDLMNRFADF